MLRSYSKCVTGLRNESYSERLESLGLQSQERRVERFKVLYIRKMICGIVPNLGVMVVDSRWGPIVEVSRSNRGTDHTKSLVDRSLLVEGSRLYNSIPRRIREFKGTYLGFKNCVDRLLLSVPDCPREVGAEPMARNGDGQPSNSLKDWMKSELLMDYDDSWVPRKRPELFPDPEECEPE